MTTKSRPAPKPANGTAPFKPAGTPAVKKKGSSVRHTRAIQRDRAKRPTVGPPDEQVAARLTELIHPATLAQLEHYRALGLRERVLTLPVMVALVLSMIWRQFGAVAELHRVLRAEGVLWTGPLEVRQQSLSERLRSVPAPLFRQVLDTVLPTMQTRWHERQRPLPPEVAWAQEHYAAVLTVDGSTLDGLLRKVGLLRQEPTAPLAGRMIALLDVASRLPRTLWYEEEPQAHDQRGWPELLAALPAGSLVTFDLGFTNFARFAELTRAEVTFVTRAKSNLSFTVDRPLRRTSAVHEDLVWVGSGADRQRLRLLTVLWRGTWYRYLTNELDPERLPVLYAVALYWQRWRIEDAYAIVKRLLGLAYFWTGSQHGVLVQLWATWLLYAVLVDLTDAVAEALNQPLATLSLELVYRGLYHFTRAYHRGDATDPVAYLAANADWLGVLKRPRKSRPDRFQELTLTLAAGP